MGRFDNGFKVDGDLFAARDSAVLPPRCVKTNSRENLEQVTKQLKWVDPKHNAVGAMFGLVGAILVSSMAGSKCSLTYYISKSAKLKQTAFSLAGWGLIGLGFLLFMLGTIEANERRGPTPDKTLPAWSAIGLLIGLLVGSFILVKFGSIFSVKKYENGVFWVKGASPAFLYDHPVQK